MSEFVNESDLGFTGQDRIHIHFFHNHTVIFLPTSGNDFQSLGEFGDFGTAVRFEKPDDHIDPFILESMAFLKHLIGLAYPCAVAEVNLQPSALSCGGSS